MERYVSISENLTDLVILRHGEAGNASIDRDRKLTELGRSQIILQYKWLKERDFEPQQILHSPYVRTTETAALAAEFYPNAELLCETLITPDADPLLAASFIESLSINKVLIVSHMPMVAYLTQILVPNSHIFGFPVAGLCWVKVSEEGEAPTIFHKHWVK